MTQWYPRAAVAITVLRPRAAAATAPREFLLAQRTKPPSPGSWTLPGGKIEPGERALAAGARELLEECGLDARSGVRFAPLAYAHSDALDVLSDDLDEWITDATVATAMNSTASDTCCFYMPLQRSVGGVGHISA